MKKKWKPPTWEDLIHHIDRYHDLRRYIGKAPKRLRPALAAALAVAKWHPDREANLGKGYCGLCALYRHHPEQDCCCCPLRKRTNRTCFESGSLFLRAFNSQLMKTKPLFTVLCEIYAEEWEKLK